MSFATQLQNLAGGNVTFATIPVTSIDGTGDYGESVVTIDVNQVHAFFQEALGEAEPAPEDGSDDQSADQAPDLSEVEVHVLNASYVEGLANGIAAQLQELGYSIAETGNAAEGLYYESQILAAEEDSAKALAISKPSAASPSWPTLPSTTTPSSSYPPAITLALPRKQTP